MANHTTLSQDNLVERISSLTTIGPSTSFLVSPSSSAPILEINTNSFHSPHTASTTNTPDNSYIQTQHVQPNAHQHSATSSSSSYTFLQIKREPCQVSEITTSNHHQQEQSSGKTISTGASSSTLTTVVKIESSSPKNQNLGCNVSGSGVSTATVAALEKNNVPVGIAIARKRQQEQSTLPASIQRDCFGIRVGELNSVGPTNACANIFFTGNDLSGNSNQDNLHQLTSPNIQNVGRTASSFWQYPSTGSLDSVLQMPLPPAGFQYARDANRGQLLLFPTTPGIEPIPQTYVWPYMHTNTNAIQATSNFLFPPLAAATAATAAAAPQTSPFVPFQIYGSNYLATASTTLHHHTQTHGTRLVAFSATDNKPKNQIQPPPLTPISNNKCTNNPIMKIEDIQLQTTSSHNFGPYPKNIVAPQQQQMSQTSPQITPTGPPPLQAFTNYVEFEKEKIQTMPLQLTNPSQATAIESHTPVLPIPVIQTPVIPSISTQTTIPQSFLPHQIHSNEANENVTVYKQPEMQDVNIQTDTPIMSEEENTLGPDESVFQINNPKQPNLDTNNEVIITSSTVEGESIEETNVTQLQTDNNKIVREEEDHDMLVSGNQTTQFPPPQQHPEDLTGLELLSAASFESNKIVIKQEKFDAVPETNSEALEESMLATQQQPPQQQPCEQLGGLKLLCALAEQRIHEEAEGKISPSPPLSPNQYETLQPTSTAQENTTADRDREEFKEKIKKKKRKHSKSKSSKKNKNGSKNHKHNHENEFSSSDEIESDMKSAFKKVQYKFMKHHKCSYSEKHCRAKCNWPDPEEFFKVFESDMRSKLAYLTKQYKKKKRKLNAFNNKIHKKKKQTEQRENDQQTPLKKTNRIFGTIASSENDDAAAVLTSDRDKEENSSPSFKIGASGQAKPWKPYGIDMMRNQKLLNDFKFSITKPSAPSEISECSAQKKIKEEKPTTTFMSSCGSLADRFDEKDRKVCSKLKKNKPIKDERTIVLKSPTLAHIEKQKEINKKLVLTNEHLYKNKIRVLTHMGGLFYAGYLSPLQPPDVYAVALDGERGNKSHIMSREEVLKDTILEISPTSLEEVKPGTRICAYWSQQYRCLYPGRAAALSESASSPSTSNDSNNFLSVEFDDGDSGRIRLENIRFLMSDYPNIEYDNSPLTTSFAKPKEKEESLEQIQLGLSPSRFSPKSEFLDDIQSVDESKDQEKSYKCVSRKHKAESEEIRKHRKHKKRKKHKKHKKNIYEVVSTTQEGDASNTSILYKNEEQSQDSQNIENTENVIISQTLNENEMESIVESTNGNATIPLNEDDDELNSRDNDNSSSYSSIDKNIDKKTRSSKDHSKIAAFLPARQLWKWLGQPYKKPTQKGRVKKSFYKSIQRGKEIITVGDSAVFLSTGRPDRPYIGRIESMWETSTNNKVVRVKWFYHPEETVGCPELKFPGALFESPHEDENDVQTISHKCEVLAFNKYEEKFGPDPKEYHFIYDNNDTYYLAGNYNPKSQCLKLDPSTPILK